MLKSNALLVAAGAAGAGIVAGLAQSGLLHKGVVVATSAVMAATDAVTAETQAIVDGANDARAEARRAAKIDAEVKARLAELEPELRAKATQKVDGEAPVA